MVGSSQSISTPNAYLNLAVAQVLGEYASTLEKASDKPVAIQAIVKDSYSKHRRVVFNGNGYSEEWVKEAERRGLPNIRASIDSFGVLTQPETVSLFESHKILTKAELESRYHIYLEKYSKQINIEAGVMIDMARRSIFPAATAFAGSLARDSASLAAIGAVSVPQEKRAKRVADLTAELFDETEKLEKLLIEAQETEDAFAQAKAYRERVVTQMSALRSRVDAVEKLVAKEVWPFPTYEDLLFRL